MFVGTDHVLAHKGRHNKRRQRLQRNRTVESNDDVAKGHDDVARGHDKVSKLRDDVTKDHDDVTRRCEDLTKDYDDVMIELMKDDNEGSCLAEACCFSRCAVRSKLYFII